MTKSLFYNIHQGNSLLDGLNIGGGGLGQSNFAVSPFQVSPSIDLSQILSNTNPMTHAFTKYNLGGADKVPGLFDKLGGLQGIGAGLQGLGALGSMFTGYKQYGLAKDQLKFQKEAFNKNFENQKKLTNARLEDRQRQRHAANPYMNARPEDYMAKHGV